MLATVSAESLNVRAMPDISANVLGVLQEGTVVDVPGPLRELSGSWAEIDFGGKPAFVYGTYLDAQPVARRLRATVMPQRLNVREQPSLQAQVLGTLAQGTVLVITMHLEGWLEIHFNGGIGYVAREFVELLMPREQGYVAQVTASALNVRSGPDRFAPILGQVKSGARLQVEARQGDWARFMFNGAAAYVHTDYLHKLDDAGPLIEVADDEHEQDLAAEPIPVAADEQDQRLEPEVPISVVGDRTQRKVANTWNRYGGLLGRLCKEKDIDPACAVAVLCVESSGKGFEQNNGNRMIIRFENHKFWKYWGSRNPALFARHFRYRSGKAWTGHEWRAAEDDEWSGFHGNQAAEWKVFEFARSLDADAAMLSISMGAPQIMGFHYKRIGYASVQQMFEAFSDDMSAHIYGLFDFFSDAMTAKLRRLDFEGFAGGYNGSGQKEKYGAWIRDHYKAFKRAAS